MKVAVICYEKLSETIRLQVRIEEEICKFIKNGADTFYFCGTKSCFDNLCYRAVGYYSQNKNIKRVLARAHYEYVSIEEDICNSVLEFTENETFYDNPQKEFIVYLRPYCDIIDLSDVVFAYFNPHIKSVNAALKYAKIKRKKIINVYELL